MKKPNVIGKNHKESLPYNFTDYKVYLGYDSTAEYPNYTEVYHWHDEVEFIIVTKGLLIFNVNGTVVQIEPGNGIFVNSQQMHFLLSEGEPCEFIYALLHPSCLAVSEYFKDNFIIPVINNSKLPFILLDKEVTWQCKVIEVVNSMCSALNSTQAPLKIQSAFYSAWDNIFAHINRSTSKEENPDNLNLNTIKIMLNYIQNNYTEKLSLEDISYIGGVSKSTCTTLFKKYLNDTPVNYLISYRLHKSSELLRNSDMPVTEIALEVGFSGISYYTEAFRKHFNMTPREYRKWHE